MNIVTRFAPSPTGNLHIGGARTAIFNYLLARRYGGKFYLRIEDTDFERSRKEYEEEIINSMKWLGMDYDGKLIYQSQRMNLYKEYLKKLIESGNAYYCDCSKEELEAQRELAMAENKKTSYNKKCREKNLSSGVIRFKMPEDGETIINDAILGEIKIMNKELDDFVVARADGTPTYNFTVVVDDNEMGITHVLRGDDHVNNTPKQLLLYNALGLTPPIFAHVPMILGSDKKKLSKRHGSTAVSQYKEAGYLPEALFNYLVRLGWSHGDDEIFTKDELIKKFNIEHIGNSASILSVEKLDWLNTHYIKNKTPKQIATLLINEKFAPVELKEKLLSPSIQAFLPMVQERSKMLGDVYAGLRFMLEENIEYNVVAIKKHIAPQIMPIINQLSAELKKLTDLNDHTAIENIFKTLIEQNNIKMKNLAQAVRVLLTGTDISPSIFEIIALMDQDILFKRLNSFHENPLFHENIL